MFNLLSVFHEPSPTGYLEDDDNNSSAISRLSIPYGEKTLMNLDLSGFGTLCTKIRSGSETRFPVLTTF